MKSNQIEKILKLIPIISGFVTILGYINLNIYYSFFGIKIVNYIDFSEILILFFDEALLLLFLLITALLISFFLDKNELKLNGNELKKDKKMYPKEDILQELEDLKIRKIELNKNFKTRITELKKKTKSFDIWATIIIGLLTLISITIDLISKSYINLVFTISFLIFLILSLLIVKPFISYCVEKKISVFLTFSILSCSYITLYIMLSTISDSIKIGYNKKYSTTESKELSFNYNSHKIKTTESIIYIGETKSNLFLYDRINNETLFFKRNDLENFKIYPNKKD